MNPRTYDMLTIQEKRSITPWISEYLSEQLVKQEYAKKRREQIALAQRQEENNYQGDENENNHSIR